MQLFFPKSRSYEKNSHHRKPLITKQSRIKANTEHGETETSSGKSVGGKNRAHFLFCLGLHDEVFYPFGKRPRSRNS